MSRRQDRQDADSLPTTRERGQAEFPQERVGGISSRRTDSLPTTRDGRQTEFSPSTRQGRTAQQPLPQRSETPESGPSPVFSRPARRPNTNDQFQPTQGGRPVRTTESRFNEYFVPREGIDEDVIRADICRYLGNDAQVRQGTYENPQTGQSQPGYFITAYRNLTSAMIADLKADSQRWREERWEAERRPLASRGQPPNAEYLASTTHHSRQHYGPTEANPGANAGYPPTPTSARDQPREHPSGYQYQSHPGYANPTVHGGYQSQDPVYAQGAGYYPATGYASDTVPHPDPGQYASSYSTYQTQPETREARDAYYSSQMPASSGLGGYATQQTADPYYGRAPPDNTYSDPTPETNGSRYQYSAPYEQPPTAPPSNITTTAEPSRRRRDRDDRDRDRDRPRDRHH